MPSAFPAFWILRDDQGQWTWKFAQTEGDFVASSSKAYASRQECAQAVKQMRAATNVAVFSTIDDLDADAPPQPARRATRAAEPAPTPAPEPLELSSAQRLQDDRATRPADPPRSFVGGLDNRAQFLTTGSRTAEAAKKA